MVNNFCSEAGKPVKTIGIILLLSMAVSFCTKKTDTPQPVVVTNPFTDTPISFTVAAGKIDEASGMVASKANSSYLWVIEDSFKPSNLHLLKTDGTYFKSIALKNILNVDWEEITLAKDNATGKNKLYVGDIGDNYLLLDQHTIYRMDEPLATADTIADLDKIVFKYTDGRHNAEAFLVDETNGDIYIITKAADKAGVYKLAAPQSLATINTATKVTDLTLTNVTAACINSTELLIKNYDEIKLYPKLATQNIAQALQAIPVAVSYVKEQQGESICFATDNSGFYTISEKVVSPGSLYFYKRK